MGYDEVVFKHTVEKHLECPICLFALKSPVQTGCGHLFCHSCITPILRQRQPKCPLDKTLLDKSQLFPDNYTNNQLLELTVLCNNQAFGCCWEGPLRELQTHIDACPFASSPCRLQCGQVLTKQNLKEHEETLCMRRKLVCQHCSQHIQAVEMDTHLSKDCQRVEVGCRYNCGIPRMVRSKMNHHVDPETGDCPKAVIPCPFYESGCHQMVLRCQLESHVTDQLYLSKHMLAIGRYFTQSRKQADAEARLRTVEETLERTESLVQILEADKNRLEHKVETIEGRLDRALAITGGLERNVGDLEMALQLTRSEFDRSERQSQTGRERRDLTFNTEVVSDAITEVSADCSSTPAFTVSTSGLCSHLAVRDDNDLFADLEASKQKLRDIEKQLSSMDIMTTARDISISEQDLRLQVLENSFYDGVLLWKIPNFRRRRQDAVSGRSVSRYSPPFFTSRRGYKMCSRVYLNGDGIGKGTHLSLFFVVMKGQFDALLPWPFRQRVTLMVLDQGSQKRHVQDTFVPEQQGSSFQLPLSDMNVASGCPLFISLQELETKGYVKDDTLFVCVKVDCSNLPQF